MIKTTGTNPDDVTGNGGWVAGNIGYYTMQMGWISLQFKTDASKKLSFRVYYGDGGWGGWNEL